MIVFGEKDLDATLSYYKGRKFLLSSLFFGRHDFKHNGMI